MSLRKSNDDGVILYSKAHPVNKNIKVPRDTKKLSSSMEIQEIELDIKCLDKGRDYPLGCYKRAKK